MPEREGSRERAVSWAAIVLVALAWLASGPGSPRPADPCSNPREVAARDSRTIVVRCAQPNAPGPPVRGPARLLFGEPLDLNRAPLESLSVLPGIGPVRAAAIVAARNRQRFRSLDDLRAVYGIGPRTVAGLAGWVTVGPPATEARAAPAPDG